LLLDVWRAYVSWLGQQLSVVPAKLDFGGYPGHPGTDTVPPMAGIDEGAVLEKLTQSVRPAGESVYERPKPSVLMLLS
jgi:hypothetical protein